MAEEVTKNAATTEPVAQDDTVAAERFREVAKHKKAAEERAKTLEQQINELKAQIDEREQANLPDLEKLQKRLEVAEKRAQEAEQRAEDSDRNALNLRKEGWVTAAARELGFIDPEDALNPRHVALDQIESREDAERVLKRVAKAKTHLIKPDEPERPQIGQVLTNGQPTPPGTAAPNGDLNDPGFKRALGEEMLGVLRGGK